jgi:hypothetical protein
VFVVFNHQWEWILTLSNSWGKDVPKSLNNLWLRSFPITQTHRSQMRCKKERCARSPPEEWMKWWRWSDKFRGSTNEKPIYDRTKDQREPKKQHASNNCWADSTPPQLDTHIWAYVVMMPLAAKLTFSWQPISQKSLGKNRHLQKNLFVPKEISSCIQQKRT